MKLSQDIKNQIKAEYEAFKEEMYNGKTKAERDMLAQFFTPAEISIKLIEEFDDMSGNILDPTCGSGNLLAACLIAGADADKIFGNEYDANMVKKCRERIKTIPIRLETVYPDVANKISVKLNSFNDWQIHQGNALQKSCLIDFGPNYVWSEDWCAPNK